MVARKIVTPYKVRWAFNSSKPYKSPGPDGIYPVLIQKGLETLAPVITRLFRASRPGKIVKWYLYLILAESMQTGKDTGLSH